MDDRDVACTHLARDDYGQPIGTVRLDLEAGGKIGRLAVLAARAPRRRPALMERVHELARARVSRACGATRRIGRAVLCEARLSTSSEPFDEAGIAHVRMEFALST